ncbi:MULTISPECIES: twin-arginine translocase TatA/TatE family subunit [unclassified Pseudomonas]|jgi:sec-independent protein translocase protein TatA|uniref:twin-arginine translocase TatA/TatE family subunit n=1 Tax=unclassified Pseudomonas TaxID=196821 RepID=UPI00069F5FDC|nr:MULTISPECIES: twin-arginine translocase TatA/TatE family subunit [unclassified Pseudomonas]WPN49665.1 twin-arginine translocase TatA/TatE family subunit [Pseudomonas sp. P8_241]
MGLAGLSLWKVGLVLVLVLVFFGGKRLRGMGADVGTAIKELRHSLAEDAPPPAVLDEAEPDRRARS